MKIKPFDLFRAEREEVTPTGRAIECLTEHPYGNLQGRLRRPTVALMLWKYKDNK